MCLLLFHGGILQSYSKGNKPCEIVATSVGVEARFLCWYIKKQSGSDVSFQVQACFVKRVCVLKTKSH